MSNIARVTKPGGTTAWADGDTLTSAHLNGDIDAVVAVVNGDLSDVNVTAAAGIELSKLDGYSDSATEMATRTSPGISGATSAATTMQGELERLRQRIQSLGVGISTLRLDGTANADEAAWYDHPQNGPNLIRNGNFAVKTTGATAAPDGWALVGSPASLTIVATGVSEGHATAPALRITSDAANEGISQTLVGLKAGQLYVIGLRGKVSAGGDILRLTTTGADAVSFAGAFANLSLSTSSTSYTTIAGMILTDATPTNIVLNILAVGNPDTVDVTHVWVRECETDILPMSDTAWAYDEVTGLTPDHYTTGGNIDAAVSAAVVCPGPGYVIEVKGHMDVSQTAAGNIVSCIGRLRENTTEVQSSSTVVTGSNDNGYASIHFDYVNLNPTPGTTYTYDMTGRGVNQAVDRNHTAVGGETPKTWIRCRAVLQSGGH